MDELFLPLMYLTYSNRTFTQQVVHVVQEVLITMYKIVLNLLIKCSAQPRFQWNQPDIWWTNSRKIDL